MIDPPSSVDNLEIMADWAELSVLTSAVGQLSRDEFGETLDKAGYLGLQDGGLPPGEQDWEDDDTFTPDDASERFSDELWLELDGRRQRVSERSAGAFPFELDTTYLRLDGGWQDLPAYTMLLLLDHGRIYSEVDVAVAPESAEGRLFEKIVEASSIGLFGGPAARFGWPIEPGWPTHPRDRVEHLATLLGLSHEDLTIADKIDSHDKDKGLDVVSGWNSVDSASIAGQPWVLVQCACGDNWKSKTGEPSFAEWHDLLAWNGPLVKAVALPWLRPGGWTVARVSRKFQSALVLTRERLLRGSPDAHLDAATANEIRNWCAAKIATLPMV